MWPDQYERIAGAGCIVVHKVHHNDVSQYWKDGCWGVEREGDRGEEGSDTKGASRAPGPVSRGFPHIVVQPKRLQVLLCTLFVSFVLDANCCWCCCCKAMPQGANLHIICILGCYVQWQTLICHSALCLCTLLFVQNNLFNCQTRFGLQAQGLLRNWAYQRSEKISRISNLTRSASFAHISAVTNYVIYTVLSISAFVFYNNHNKYHSPWA